MRTIPAGEFKQTCLQLLDEVEATREPIVITKRGRPVAQVVPLPTERAGAWLGALRGRGEVPDDLAAYQLDAEDWGSLWG